MTVTRENIPRLIGQRQQENGLRTRQELADSIGVSTSTLARLLRGKFFGGDKFKEPERASQRQLQGYAETLTRVALFLGVAPEALIKSYGIDPALPGLQTSIANAARDQAIANRHGGDSVIDRIRNRTPQIVSAGILKWEPFVEAGESVDASWAHGFMRRLIASVNPDWVGGEANPVHTIKEALDAVSNKNQLDCCFGLYDTPSRRVLGLDFLQLPGLGVALGSVAIPGEGISEKDLYDRRHSGIVRFVIENEVGDHFLRGPCGLRDIVQLQNPSPDYIAARLATRRAMSPSPPVVFVANYATCTSVARSLQFPNRWKTLAHDIFDASIVEHDMPFKFRTLTGAAYEVGIAFDANATRWGKLLKLALQREMFRNTVGLAAAAYATLLLKNHAQSTLVNLPLLDTLPAYSARNFLENLRHEAKTYPPDERDILRKRIARWHAMDLPGSDFEEWWKKPKKQLSEGGH